MLSNPHCEALALSGSTARRRVARRRIGANSLGPCQALEAEDVLRMII
jgi:hypothetical protein